MAAGAGGEAARHLERLGERRDAAGQLGVQGVLEGEVVLAIGAEAIGAQRQLRRGGELMGERDGGGAGGAGGDDAVGEADGQGLIGVDGAAGEDEVEGAGEADEGAAGGWCRHR